MKLHHYPKTDGLCSEPKAAIGIGVREVAKGLHADLDSARQIIGFDIDPAAARFVLTTVDTQSLPARAG